MPPPLLADANRLQLFPRNELPIHVLRFFFFVPFLKRRLASTGTISGGLKALLRTYSRRQYYSSFGKWARLSDLQIGN